MLIVRRAGVLIPHQHGDRRSERFAFKNTRKYLNSITLLTRCREVTLTRFPAVEFKLYCGHIQVNLRWASINHNTNSTAMRFAPGGNPKKVTECIHLVS